MQYTALIKYNYFCEKFSVSIVDGILDITLDSIITIDEYTKEKGAIVLDLSEDVKQAYTVFPLQNGDLLILQEHNEFYIAFKQNNEIAWNICSSQELILFLMNEIDFETLIAFSTQDKTMLLNMVLSDLIRNDFSYSKINKEIKHIKTSIMIAYIQKNFQYSFNRIIFDETFLGDVQLEHVIMSFRFAESDFLQSAKINNKNKIVTLLEKEKILTKTERLLDEIYFLNAQKGSHFHLKLDGNGTSFNYSVDPVKNYIYSLGNSSYTLHVNHKNVPITNKLFVYNGDNSDLMIE